MVLIVRVPYEPSRHRVAVWRELRRVEAIQLGQGNWALPQVQAYAVIVTNVIELVGRHEGEVLTLNAVAADDLTADRIRALYDDARRGEWAEFESECGSVWPSCNARSPTRSSPSASSTKKNNNIIKDVVGRSRPHFTHEVAHAFGKGFRPVTQ